MGHVQVNPRPEMTFTDDTAVVVPASPISLSQQFTVPVYGHATYSIAAFSLLCHISANLVFEDVTIDTDKWLTETRPSNIMDTKEVGVVAILNNPELAPQVMTAEPEVLFSLNVRVLTSAQEDGVEAINCTTVYLSNILNQKIQPGGHVTPTPSLAVDVAIRPGAGQVRIARSQPRGVFSFSAQSQVANTAVLDGQAVSVQLTHLVAMSSGVLVNAPSLQCSTESQAFQLPPQCNQIILDGTELAGTSAAIISTEYMNFTSSVSIRVWYPTLPASIQVTPDILRPIEGWLEAGSDGQCFQRYQEATLGVFANFSYSDSSSPVYTVSVLPLVADLLNSSDHDVVAMSSDGMTLTALSPGTSTISLDPTLSPTLVTVSNVSISTASLDVTLFSDLRINLPPSPYTPLSTQTLSIDVDQTFATISTPVFVSLVLVLEGGYTMVLEEDKDTVTISSSATTVVDVSEGNITLLGPGSGDLVQVMLTSPCTGVLIVAGNGSAEVTTPDPVRLDVSQSSTRLTYPDDTAAISGILTSLSFSVTLVFPDGLTREATDDELTTYTILSGADLITLVVTASSVLITASDPARSAFGQVLIQVDHGDYPISINVSFNVVTYQRVRLQATPFPSYEGSSLVNKSTLFQIEDTGQFQQAALELEALLSDGSSVFVTQSSLAFYRSVSPEVTIAGNIVSVTEPGTYQIQGQLGPSTTSTELLVISLPVTISTLQELSLQEVGDTFTGNTGTTSLLNLDITFSDMTEYPSFIPDALGLFSQLLSLTVDTPSVVSINPLRAQVTLQNNHHSLVTITASTSGSPQLLAHVRFACNLQPRVGDVDIGLLQGVPIPPVVIGSTFSVPLVINSGPQLLGRAQLTVSYSIQTLSIASVTQNSSWLGTFEQADTPGIGLTITATSPSGQAGLVYLGSLELLAVSSGVGSVGGIVMELTDTAGNPIGDGSLRRFVAGDVTVDILAERSRRESDTFLSRATRTTQCSPPFPCSVCPDSRETGDLNGDCVFDSTDVQFLVQYHAEDLFDFQLDSGSDLLSSLVMPQQLDSDLNSAIDLQDAYFLHEVQSGLLNFLQSVSIEPIQESSTCQLTINATLLGGGDTTPDTSLTAVFFDLALPFDPTFTSQRLLDESDIVVGSLVLTADKGLALPGAVLLASELGPGLYTVVLETNLTMENIGISVIQSTSLSGIGTSQARTRAMIGSPDPPYAHPTPLFLSLPAFSDTVSVRASEGYTSFASFNNSMTTLTCFTPPPPPVIAQPLLQETVPEDVSTGTDVVTISAQSQSDRSVEYSIASGNIGGVFSVGTMDGVVRIARPLDYEAVDFYTLRVLATDPATGFSSSGMVEVTVSDINDNAPVFVEFQEDISLPANTPIGAIVTSVTAQDRDSGSNAMVSYTVQGNTFSVDSELGLVILEQMLDFDVQDTHLVIVIATDMGSPQLSSSVVLNVTVLPPAPTVLQFEDPVYNTSVLENSPNGVELLEIVAVAVNETENVPIVYTLLSPDSAPFEVNESSGVLAVNGNIDHEMTPSYTLSITATVLGSDRVVAALAVVFVSVLDVNDNSPTFDQVEYTFTTPEEMPPGTLDFPVTASDPDTGLGGIVQYSLLETSSVLSIDGVTGVVTNVQQLDSELAEVIVVTVLATDSGDIPLVSSVNVTVVIVDVNDNPPLVVVLPAVVTINESAEVGSVLGVVEVTDEDSEANGDIDLQVLIDGFLTTDFAINSMSGEITSSIMFDYESVRQYNLVITATDNGSPPLTSSENFTVLISDVNDNAPQFEADTYNVSVSEDTPVARVILDLTASDADSGLNAELQFSIVSVAPPSSTFLLNSNGSLQIDSPLDFEETQRYEIEVMVENTVTGVESAVATVNVEVTDINEFPPSFSQDVYQASVSEETSGARVLQVLVTDSDLSDSVTLSVDDPNFMVGQDGVLVTSAALDREVEEEHNITVQATDDGKPPNTASALVIVTLLDINDNSPLLEPVDDIFLLETTPVGTILLTFSATDADDGVNGTISGFSLSTPTLDFELSPDGQLSVARPLNASTMATYQLSVMVQDGGDPGLNSTTAITIDVAPSPLPIFEQSVYTVSTLENNPNNSFLVQVRAASQNPEAVITAYMLVSGSESSQLFAVDSVSGNVTIQTPLNREERTLYSIMIEAEAEFNSTIFTATTEVDITVIDENDNPPQFVIPLQSIIINETITIGVEVAGFEAMDADIGSNADIEYLLSSGNNELQLTVDQNGTIRTAASLLGISGLFNVTVTASNPAGSGGLSSDATLFVEVFPVNEFDPAFDEDQYTATIAEDAEVLVVVVTASAMDFDLGSAGSITYSIPQGNGVFVIDSATGNVTLEEPLDFESEVTYNVTLVATDDGVPTRSATSVLYVEVADVNDNPPVFTQDLYTGTLDENSPAGQSILSVRTEDNDTSPNSIVTYDIISSSLFLVTPEGVLQNSIPLDRENLGSVVITIQALNSGSGVTFTATTTASVVVIDVNDNSPVFSESVYSRVVQAPLEQNTSIVTVLASDGDILMINSMLQYSIVDSSNTFSIDLASGEIQTTTELTSEGNFTFTVVATDTGSPMMSSEALVNVLVLSEDDLTAGREEDFVFSTDDGISVLRDPSELTADSYQQPFGFAVGTDNQQSRTISAGLGSLSSSLQVSLVRLTPDSVKAVLVSDEIWHDEPMVRLVVQVRDQTHNVHVTAPIRAQVTHLTEGSVEGSCTTRASDGTCTIVIALPSVWFGSGGSVTVEYGLSSSSFQSLGTVQVQEQPLFTADTDVYTYVEMPLRALFVGNTLAIPVYGRTGSKAVGSFTLTVQGSNAVNVRSLTVDASTWSAQVQTGENGGITITAVRSNQMTVPPAEEVLLFTIQAQVSGSSNLDVLTLSAVTALVIELSDFDRFRLLPLPEMPPDQSFFLSRNNITRSGAVYVASDQVIGVLPYTVNAELVNTALLDGGSASEAIQITNVHRSGGVVGDLGSSLSSCSSSDPAVVAVAVDCSSIVLASSQTTASLSTTINITLGDIPASFPVLVWVPQMPLSLTATDQSLETLANVPDPLSNCAALRQSGRVSAFANFTNTLDVVEHVDVTDLVTMTLSSSDEDTAVVAGILVQGKQAGMATIQASSSVPGVTFAGINVLVSDSPVEVLGLDVRVFTEMEASGPRVVSRTDINRLNITTRQMFDFEGTQGMAIATAVFSDGSRILLDESQVSFTSVDTDIVAVSGSLVTAVASGTGPLVEAVWNPPQLCAGVPIATGQAEVSVEIPMPTSVSVVISTPTLSAPGSTANLIGVPSSSTLRVTAVYADGRTQDLSADNRTVYITPDNVDITISGSTVTIVTNSNATLNGDFSILASFLQFQELVQNATFTVVSVADIELRANPSPAYPGSDETIVTTLSPLAASDPLQRQQAIILATALLSDGDTVDISTNAELDLEVMANSTTLQGSIVVTRDANINLLSFTEASASGSLSVTATLGREVTPSRPLTLNIPSNPIQIADISIFPFPDDNTLKGVVDSTTRQVVISVTFDDSTQYINLFQDITVPNLVTFEATPSSAVTIDAASGLVTLRGNLLTMATITVSSLGSTVSQNLTFSCNLDPSVGDVDLGSLTGAPLSPVSLASQLSVPVRVNSGAAVLDSLQLDVTFDPNILRAVTAVKGSDWPSTGQFQFNNNDPVDIITVGGTLVGSASIRGPALHLATIQFEAVGVGITAVSGIIHTLARQEDSSGVATNIGLVPRDFVAGSVQAVVTGSSRRRRSSDSADLVTSSRFRRQSGSECPSPPCDVCSPQRVTGDVDGNCVFDVRDVSFLQLHHLTNIATGMQPELPEDRRKFLDADLNGVVDANDVVFMLRVSFRLLRFASLPVFSPVDVLASGDCELAVNITLLSAGDVPADPSSTAVIFDLANDSPDFQVLFDATNFTAGVVIPMTKGPGAYGGLVEAEYFGGGVYGIQAESAFRGVLLGISPIQVTFDANGNTSGSRTAAMFSSGVPLYNMLDATFLLREQTVDISTQLGYSPLLLGNSSMSTLECLLFQAPLAFTNAPYRAVVSESAQVDDIVLEVTALSSRPSPLIVYSLDNASILPFALNISTGELVLSVPLDFETDQSYTFQVLATESTPEGETFTASATVVITVNNINDHRPVITPSPITLVLASQEVGEQVLQVEATDPDNLDSLVYSISDASVSGLFSINSSTGDIAIAASLLESANTFVNLIVTVSDGMLSASVQVPLEVFLPSFSQLSYSASILENSAVGDSVASVVLINTGDEVFVLETLDSSFMVDGSGVVRTNAVLDYEAQQSHHVGVVATSVNVQVLTNLTVDLVDENDNAPEFPADNFNVSIPVGTAVGASLIQLAAIDRDSPGPNSNINYSIFSTNVDLVEYFAISSDTGNVTLLQNLFGGPSSVIVNVTATDSGTPALDSSVTLVIMVVSPDIPDFPIAPIVRTLGGVIAMSTPTRINQLDPDDVAFQQAFTKLSTLPNGQLSASFPGSSLESSATVSTPLQAARTMSAHLLHPTGAIYQEDRDVTVSLQVRDNNHLTNVEPSTSVEVQAELINLETNNTVTLASCTPDQNSGVCLVTVSLPEDWFSSSDDPRVSLTPVLNNELFETLEVLTLHPSPLIVPGTITNSILIECPSRDIVSGASVLLHVYGYSAFTISGFSILFTTQSHVAIIDHEVLIDTAQWSVQTANSSNVFVVSAISSSPAAVDTLGDGDRVLLFSLRVHTVPVLLTSTTTTITAQVQSLSNVVEGSVVLGTSGNTSGPAQFLSRAGVGNAGIIHISPNAAVALYPFTQQSELVNTAVLDAVAISIPVQFHVGYASGDVLPFAGSGLTCTSSDTAVVNPDPSCSRVLLSGSETAGSGLVVIMYTIASTSGSLPLRVYFPQEQVSYVLTDSTLNSIQYSQSCASYQQVTLSAFIDFTASTEHHLPSVPIADLIASRLFTNNTSVLALDGVTLQGLSPGAAEVCATAASSVSLGCVDVSVSNEPVKVSGLVGSVLVEVSVTTDSPDNNSSSVANIQPRSQFQFEQEQGTLLVSAQYSDETISAVSTDEVTILTSESSVFAVLDNTLVVMESGEAVGRFQWQPVNQECNVEFFDFFLVTSSLPTPIDIQTSLPPTTHILTTPTDPASLASIPTSLNLVVILVFEGGRTLDATDDSRVTYVTPGDAVAVVAGVLTTTGEVRGALQLVVQFQDGGVAFNTTVDLFVVVSMGIEVQAHPFPSYTGSEHISTTILSPIENTGVWERASLQLQLLLSDGTSLDVTALPEAMLEHIPVGTSTASVQISHDFVLTVVQGSGLIQIIGRFPTLPDHQVPLRIEGPAVTVTAASIIPLPSSTLRGIVGAQSQQLSIDLTLSDGTQLPSYPSNPVFSDTVLTGIVMYTSASSAFNVSSEGVLQPLINTHNTVSVAVSAGSEQVSNSSDFVVNLDPDVGDVDIGMSSGSQVQQPRVGEEQILPVTVNTGDSNLGSLDILLLYDVAILMPLEVTAAPGFVAGLYQSSLNDPPGEIRFGGALSEDVSGTAVHIFNLRVRFVGAGESSIQGTVLTMAERTFAGAAIGPPTPRAIIAGDITFTVPGNMKRSATDPYSPSHMRNRRQMECPEPPCSCSGESLGDTDGNCVFDIRDVSYTLLFITENLLPTSSRAPEVAGATSAQRRQLDPNQDGVIDASDGFFLLRALFRLVYFLEGVMAIPVQDPASSCFFSVELQLRGADEDISLDQVEVLVDIAFLDSTHGEEFESSMFVSGELLTADKGASLNGGIVLAEQTTNGTFAIQFNSTFVSDDIGVSVIVVTFDAEDNTSPSRSVQFFGRPPLLYPFPLNLNVTVRDMPVFVAALSGYSPLVSTTNTLLTSQCSDSPILEGDLNVTFTSPFRAELSWQLLNLRSGVNFTSELALTVTSCKVSQTRLTLNDTCSGPTNMSVSNSTSHTLPTTPFTAYYIQVLAPSSSTYVVGMVSPEATPSGVELPAFVVRTDRVDFEWTLPSSPNGVITHYTLFINTMAVFNGSQTTFSYKPDTGALQFYLEAHNSAGTGSSSVETSLVITEAPPSGRLSLAAEEAIIICLVVTAFIIAVLLSAMLCCMFWRRQQQKPKGPAFLSSNFDAENIGVVSV